MEQTLLPPASAQPAIYDLLARQWTAGAAVTALAFDRTGGAVAFALADGRVALAPLEEAEPPAKRLRLDVETGRSTIRPRQKPVPPPTMTEPLGEGAPLLAPSGAHGFLVATAEGRLCRVTPRGQVVPLLKGARPVSALASDGRGRFAAAFDGEVALLDEADPAPRHALPTAGSAAGLAFSPDGRCLAIATGSRLALWQPGQPPEALPVEASGPVAFSPDGDWLAGPERDGGLWLLHLPTGRIALLGRFRAPPASTAFSARAGAVFASGAFRIVGWSLATPPFDSEATGALRTGRSGLVLVEALAAHPTRDLVAYGMADGAVGVAQAGRPDEMPLRHADGAAVTALGWSADGSHLALGTARGDAALVTFPPQLFK